MAGIKTTLQMTSRHYRHFGEGFSVRSAVRNTAPYLSRGKQRWRCSKKTADGKVYCSSPLVYENELESTFTRMVGEIDLKEVTASPPKIMVDIKQKYNDPFKQAEYTYSLTAIDDFEYQTEKLVSALQEVPTEFDSTFMKEIIKRIEVSPSGEINFILINEKLCKEAMNDGNISADENVGDTSKTENKND